MSFKLAAGLSATTIPTLVVSNDGGSSSRTHAKFQIRETPGSPLPQGSSSPTKSEQNTAPASSSSVYSDCDQQSWITCPLSVPREHALDDAARTALADSTPRPSSAPDPLQEPTPRASSRADPSEPKAQPTLMSSLRLSLASFVSRLFHPSKKANHNPASSKTWEDDRKESERLDRWSARQAFLPLR